MKIIYMGTPEFAMPALRMLYEEGHEIPLVVTRPDRARNRNKVTPTPVKELALSLGLEVVQPDRITGNEEFLTQVKEIAPDMIVVASYGRILPPELLAIPPLGCINIHGSLLPKYRGASPVQTAILKGETETGVTLMHMAEGLDTGDMITVRTLPVEDKTYGQVLEELGVLGAELLKDTLPALADGTAARTVQNDAEATYAPIISKKDGLIDFARSPREIECQVRAFQPWPGAFTYWKGEMMKILKALPLDKSTDKAPGTVLAAGKDGIDVAAGGQILRITHLQMPGKKGMEASAFLRGNSMEAGEILG